MQCLHIHDSQAGEQIISEEPYFQVPASSTSPFSLLPITNVYMRITVTENPIVLLNKHLKTLTPFQVQIYYALSHHAIPPKPNPGQKAENDEGAIADYLNQRTLSIFQTNAISTDTDVGLFPRTARLNHACLGAFNAGYSWRGGEGVLGPLICRMVYTCVDDTVG